MEKLMPEEAEKRIQRFQDPGRVATEEISKSRLEALGMTAAAKKISSAEKMKVAYAKYLFITHETVEAFNEKLRKDTLREDKNARTYKILAFTDLSKYPEAPPSHVLDALEEAQKDGCFDNFEVAKIQWHREVKDPILFGKINGCSDLFFISQWDDDVKIEDLMFMEK